ncbi:MAG: response regulator [Bacteroidota bacterium]|nr:response regulator [Bacteroidota bacterium]MDP4226244.1 response regulator [Bacteroidota bacterium]MDP4272915.1 response regulator [Bacteroidota bacterium]
MMNQGMIKILHLEDNIDDAFLIEQTIEKDNISCEFTRVGLKQEFIEALNKEDFDVILSDNCLPDFDGISALNMVREKAPDVPFIFVSGTLDEKIAIQLLHYGAVDYALKSNLNKLSSIVLRAIAEAEAKKKLKEKEEAIRLNEERLVYVAKASRDTIWDFDCQTGKVWRNEAIEPHFKYRPEDIIDNLNWWEEKLHPDDRERVKNDFQRVLYSKDNLWSAEYRWKCADGQYAYVADRAFIIRDTQDRPIRIIGSMSDISLKKKTDLQIKFQSDILQQIKNAVAAIDLEGNISFWNHWAEDLYGWKASDVLGENIFNPDLFHSFTTNVLKGVFDQVLQTGTVDTELVIQRYDRSYISVAFMAAGLYNEKGELDGVTFVTYDITAQKKAQEEILEAKKKAEELNLLKSCFLTNMSHELRTPMNAIMGFAQLLDTQAINETQREMVENILAGAERLSNTLNNILELSRAEASHGSLNLCACNLAAELQQFLKDNFYKVEKKGLQLVAKYSDPEVKALVDPKIFCNIIEHLFLNAIKFTEKGTISFDVKSEKVDNKKWAVVECTDTGIGIAQKDLKEIFEPFRQESEGFERKYEGAGLGLTISQKFAELMNGFITVESQKGMGSSFFVHFPASASESDLELDKEDQEVHGLSSILVVEDNSANSLLVQMLLKDTCEVDIAESGMEALDKVSEKKYSLILMDINLGGGIDGIETLHRIRQNKAFEKIPVIAVTAYAMYGDREKFLTEGFDDYLSKPYTLESINNIIQQNIK